MSSVSREPARSTISRITVPLRSHGVTMVSWTTWVLGSPATTCDSGRSTAASRSSSFTSVTAASYAGRNSGHTHPPSGVPANSTLRAAAVSMRLAPHSRVRTTASSDPRTRSTALVALTGTATLAPGTASRMSATMLSSSSSGPRMCPVSSTTTASSPSGSITNPRSLPETRTSSASRATCASRTSAVDVADAVLANGLTASTSAPSLVSRLGMPIEAAPNE